MHLKLYYFWRFCQNSFKMRFIFSILILIMSFLTGSATQNTSQNSSFISPLKGPFSFAGGFGELRPSHFHSGLDFRTQGKIGLPVFAAKDGYISRIGISSTGYGNALYMNHSDGTTTVYGHLLKFNPKIREYTTEKQYDRESFQINLTPSSDQFCFKKGEIIGWTGNSGSSGGPHLHFEVRDTKSETALNPLLYNLGITDKSAPKIIALYIYPLDDESNVGNDNTKKRFETIATSPGKYRLKNKVPIELLGQVGFGIQAEDFFNGTGMKCGIYSATLFCDNKEVFGFKMDKIAFQDTRYANSQADFEEHLRSNRWIEHLFRQPGNILDLYYPKQSNGIMNFTDGQEHDFEVIVCDAFKNKSILRFKTTGKKSKVTLTRIPYTKVFLYDRPNNFENDKIRIEMPTGVLYDNLKFKWKTEPTPAGCYSEMHQVHNGFTPVNNPYTLSLKCQDLPDHLKDKALIVYFDPIKKKKTAVGGEYSRGWVTVKTNLLGNFSVTADQIPPTIISLSVKENKILADPQKVQFHISDDLSGIYTYRGEIDGKWVLFEYDEKSGTLTYHFDKTRMVFGKSHLLRLVVTDYKENSSEYKAIIYK